MREITNETLAKHKLMPENPDEFIMRLFELNKELACEGINKMISRLKNPPKTKDEIAQTLKKCGLPKTAEKIKSCE